MRTFKFKAQLKLNIDEWGMYKKGDIDTFYFNLLADNMGLARYPIEPQWDIVSFNEFTGHIDIDKEEIYENDRVSFVSLKEFDGYGDIKSTGTIKWDHEDTGFYIENDDDKYPHVKLWYATKLEIIK